MCQRLFIFGLILFSLIVTACTIPDTTKSAPVTAVARELPPKAEPTEDPYLEARLELVESSMRNRDIKDERILEIMETVPRHEFVPANYRNQAYEDHPLPIGYGQTISQPYIVALMTDLLDLQADDKVLEIGTGSGYQAAVLAKLVDEVWTIEIIPELADATTERFKRLGYDNIHVRTADGYYGWIEEAPFDAIIVTAAPDHIPQPLLEQLSESGRLVVPIGPTGGYQTLWQFVQEGDEITAFNISGVSFVPLVGGGQGGGID